MATFETVADLRFHDHLFPNFPSGWQTPSQITDGFLLNAALELNERRNLDWNDPFSDYAFEMLPDKFKNDGLGALVATGSANPDEMHAHWPSLEAMSAINKIAIGAQIGRLVLIDLIERFTDTISPVIAAARTGPAWLFVPTVQNSMVGVTLGRYGLPLFEAVLETMYLENHPRKLSEWEVSFLEGDEVPSSGDRVMLPQAGSMFVKNGIWDICWRILERTSPDYFIDKFNTQIPTLEYIIERGRGWNYWPGWPTGPQDGSNWDGC
jgi:hypothetical protein